MNIGTRMILSAALAVGSTIGAAALGHTSLRESPAEVAPPTFEAATSDTEPVTAEPLDAGPVEAEPPDADAREDGVRDELLAAAEAGEISWAAAERVSEELGAYIRGERRADTV